MRLSESFNRIKPACDFQSLSPGACAVTFKGGWAYTRNLSLMAKVPFPGVDDSVVAAKELQTAVRAFPDVEKARATPRTLVISKGNSNGTIPQIELVIDYEDAPLKMRPIPKGFGEAVKRIAPFISKDRTRPWSMGARIDGRNIVATNNIALVEAAMDEDTGVTALTLSNSLVEFLAANHEGIKEWGISNKEIRFGFEDGGWVRGARLNAEMPDRVPGMLNAFPEIDEDATLDPFWIEEVKARLAFAEGLITVTDEKITGQRDGLVIEVSIDTVIDLPLTFGNELLLVLDAAVSAIDFTKERIIPFCGKNFRGIMAPRSTT